MADSGYLKRLMNSAARACGFSLSYNTGLWIRDDTGMYWDALESDKDCAEMEAALMINIMWAPRSVTAETARHNKHFGQCSFDLSGNEAGKARRMASVICAASVGAEIAAVENDPPPNEE